MRPPIPAPDPDVRAGVLADPKIAALSPVARELYLISVEWCSHHGGDEFPKAMVGSAFAVAESRCRARGEIR